MNLKKSELVDLFEQLSEGYTPQFLSSILKATGRGDTYAARDYISANAVLAELEKLSLTPSQKLSLTTRKDIKPLLHPNVYYRLSFYTPMLAFRYDELSDKEKSNLFENPLCLFTEKQNGVRGILVHSNGVTSLFSRNYSTRDCSLPEYFSNIYQPHKPSEPFAVDVEIKFEPEAPLQYLLADYGISTDSRLEAMSALLQMNAPQALEIQKRYKELFHKDLIVFRLIHVLHFNHHTPKTIGEAFSLEPSCISHLQSLGLNVQPIRKIKGSSQEKHDFLNHIIDVEHGEGVVVHFLNSPYITTEKRSKSGFVKIKRSVASQAAKQGLGDSIDGWVSGFKLGTPGTDNEGLVSALEFTTTIVRPDGTSYEHVIASAPNIERSLKIQMTTTLNGVPTLKPEFYGLIGELSGQNISAKSHALTHPRLLRFPVFDKSKYDCVYSEDFILSQID